MDLGFHQTDFEHRNLVTIASFAVVCRPMVDKVTNAHTHKQITKFLSHIQTDDKTRQYVNNVRQMWWGCAQAFMIDARAK